MAAPAVLFLDEPTTGLDDEHARRLVAPISGGAGALVGALRLLDAAGVTVLDVGLRRPTLDDVFLTLTGHATEAADGSSSGRDGPAPTATEAADHVVTDDEPALALNRDHLNRDKEPVR